MTWANTWDTILTTGAKFWKVEDLHVKQQALQKIVEWATPTRDDGTLTIFCPLAGDDQFVHTAWSHGHHVVAMDLVPAAVEQMRHQFGTNGPDDWTKRQSTSSDNDDDDEAVIIWEHSSGRATLYEGDITVPRTELNGRFDAIYDKDSFGALPLALRRPYCERLSEYTKSGAVVYTEVKNREDSGGPPFHVEKHDLMEESSFGKHFTHEASLGEVYPIPMPTMTQTGHIMKRS